MPIIKAGGSGAGYGLLATGQTTQYSSELDDGYAEALGVIADQRQRLDDLEARLDKLERKARPWWAFWRRTG